jgi:hypothetical protein
MEQEDLNELVGAYARVVVGNINKNPPSYIRMQTIIYWGENEKSTQFDAPEEDKFILQVVLQGKTLQKKLEDYGKLSINEARPKTVSKVNVPLAIIISLEAIMANSTEQLPNAKKKVRGFPVLLVAGHSAEWFQSYLMVPIAHDEDKNHWVPHTGPVSLTRKLEAMEELINPFLQPFFDSFEASERNNILRN